MRLAPTILTALALAFFIGCSSEPETDYPMSQNYEDVDARGSIDDAPVTKKGGERVAILDHGLRMTRGTQVIPAGWKLIQNVATDPGTGALAKYVMDIRGPNGELARSMAPSNYSQYLGTTLDQTWRGLAMRGLQQEVQNLQLGSPQRSPILESLDGFRKAEEMGRQSGMTLEAFEAPLRGTTAGQPVAGFVYVTHFSSPQMPGSGTVQITMLVSPQDRLAEALRINEEMARSYQPNPAFEQRVREINQMAMRRQQQQSDQWMAQSQRMHQQRMAANKAQFQSHQQMMQDRYATNDAMNQQWMDNFRRDGGTVTSGGSSYSEHDAFIDGIYERNTFDDPYSGQQVHTEGYYDQWYTNGQGDYVGTNDLMFNPNAVDNGDWQETRPLSPYD